MAKDLELLFDQTTKFVRQYGGGNYPYENYDLLKLLATIHKPKRILEAGTALGLTAIAMAQGAPDSFVFTMDKDERANRIAEQNFLEYGLSERIKIFQGQFLDITPDLEAGYDMIFFDGFAPGLTIFLELERLLKQGGILVCANLTLGGDQRKIRLRMQNPEFYTTSWEFGDTIIGIKPSS